MILILKIFSVLVEVIDYLIKMFASYDENYLKLNEECFNENKDKDEEMIARR